MKIIRIEKQYFNNLTNVSKDYLNNSKKEIMKRNFKNFT